MGLRIPKIGEVVIFHDSKGQPLNALVGCVFGTEVPAINVAFMAPDENRHDTYGRQVDRSCTSVPHVSMASAHGFYWRWPEEEAREYVAPNPE